MHYLGLYERVAAGVRFKQPYATLVAVTELIRRTREESQQFYSVTEDGNGGYLLTTPEYGVLQVPYSAIKMTVVESHTSSHRSSGSPTDDEE